MNRFLYFLQCIVFLIGFSYQSHGQIISTFAGNGSVGYSGDGGNAVLASLDTPTAVAIDGTGNIYFNDQLNNRVRKVSPTGTITTVAGNGSIGFSGDGGPATNATLGRSWGIAVDAAGNIYIADQNNHRVRKVNTSGIINTIAGNGSNLYSGDGGAATAAGIKRPIGIAVDKLGNVFVADADTFSVRKITPAGTISLYAGNKTYGFSGDGGPATAASLSLIYGLATDTLGNLYICDAGNNRLRRVATNGIISTIAGNGALPGYSGDGVPATATALNLPISCYVAGNGVVYFSDCQNNRLRKISKTGLISTIAGTGVAGYNGDGIPATDAKLFLPIGVVLDTSENIYFSDMRNMRIRKINNILSFTYGDDESISVCENSSPTQINNILSVRDIYSGLSDTWSLESVPLHGNATISYSTTSTAGVVTPTGLTYQPTAGYTGQDSFRVKVANSLSSDVITIYVSVDPLLSPGIIAGPSDVCFGDTILLTNTAIGGTWDASNDNVGLFVTAAGCRVVGKVVGIDTVLYKISNACGIAFTSHIITVNPLPDPGSISGPLALCLGSSAQYVASIPGGSWSTSNLNGMVSNTGILKGTGAGIVNLVYTTSNAWCNAATVKIVTIDTFPDAGKITGPVDVCVGGQVNLGNLVSGGVWGVTTGIATVDNGIVTGISVGNDYVKYSITNTCGTAVATSPITVYPIPDIPLIASQLGILYATKGYASYQWKLNSTNISGAISDTIFAEIAGAYEVLVTNVYGCTSSSGKFEYTGCNPDDMHIYPNPANGLVLIEWCKSVSARLLTVEGKEVGVAQNSTHVEIHDIPSGIYLLVVYDQNGKRVKTYKVVMLH